MRWFAIPKMTISLPLAVIAAVALIGINETGYEQSTRAVDEMTRSQATHATLNRLLQNMLDAETGQRGYMLTGDTRYLEPYTSAIVQVNANLDELRGIFRPHSDELNGFARLALHVAQKLSEMELSVRLRKQGNEDAWKFVMLTDVGREHMDAIREQSYQLIAQTSARMRDSQAQIERSLLLARIGIAMVALIGLLAFYMYLRQTSALNRAGLREQEALGRERDRLESQVRDRTASLGELATHLQQVREEERGHLARELHDELGALLTAAKLDVARLKSKVGTAPDVVERLQHLTETLNSGIALKRRIIEDLRPSSLANLGLTASLEILTREFAERSGINLEINFETVELDQSAQLTVYRLVQESLTNIGKYAEAKNVIVTLHNYPGYVALEVRDDGNGFSVDNVRPASHGLAGMRHRVESAGGKLSVTSAPGQGTVVSAVLPHS
ncbi:sensor histidine kinase [Xylophilus sp.]|uniref:sensor histidine kinase n=1 Tax=Xylophilus sp. TaxID=2653893 RepID=UPI0013B76556|nr:CHASE3 domain-containing protein [Xylophilus sp.]KAF1044762.1 MAG: Sensor histidine kinase LiaS [Xylophilus sp.]